MADTDEIDRDVSAASLSEQAERQLRNVEAEIESLHQRLSALKPERTRLMALVRAGSRRNGSSPEGDSAGSVILRYAAEQGGRFSFQEAVQATGLSGNSVGSTLNRLIAAGRLTRSGRAVYLLPNGDETA